MSTSSQPSRFSSFSANQPEPLPFEMPLFPGHIKRRQKKVIVNQSEPVRSADSANSTENNTELLKDELQQLRTQIAQLQKRHTTEMKQLEAAWQEQLEAELALQHRSPAGDITDPVPAMPRLSLEHIATTYEVPRRLRLKWIERSLGAIPTFLLLMVAGMVLAALSAIALSPTVLWPSVSIVIQSMVPTLFVVGLFGFFATAVWNFAQ